MSWWADILGIKSKTDTPLTKASGSGPVEAGAYHTFSISITDVSYGAVASANIDITGITAYMLKSSNGNPPNIAGITQPVFNKADGLVYVYYRFLPAEWKPGDMYTLQVSGIKLNMPTGTFWVKQMDWADVITSHLDAAVMEEHTHNREYWFGLAAAPNATHFGDRTRLTGYVAISGAGDFGTDPGDTANVIGTADTPVRVGSAFMDLRRLSIIDVSDANPFILRIVWGTAIQNEAAAEAAGQFTEIAVQQQTAAGNNKAQDIIHERIPTGSQIWIRAKNQTNNATVMFLVGLHEYPAP